ncbi:MAG TPA: hypothetical protein VMI31_01150 [Fimbriimonadaceae bacterium]|nr:hypothetical protein [Fimbriimonadaceae bacterium]
MRSSLGISAFALAGLLTLASATALDGAVLKRIAKVGDTLKYKTKADLDLRGSTASFSYEITEKVTDVKSDGTYTYESKSTQGKIAYGGQTSAQADAASTLTCTPQGKLVLYISSQDDPNIYRLLNLELLHFSTDPVKVGDSWDVSLPKDDRGAVDVKGTCKLEAEEQTLGHDTYRIHVELKEGVDQNPASEDAMYWIDTKDGSLVKLSGTWTNAPWPSPIGPATTKVTMIRE